MKEVSEARVVTESSNAVKILKGLVISIIITLVLLFVYAAVLTYTNLDESTIGPVIIAITGVSILAGSTIGAGSIKKNGILNGGIIGFVYILLLYLSSSITRKQFHVKYILNYYDYSRNCCGYDRRDSRSKFKIKKLKHIIIIKKHIVLMSSLV